MIPSSKQADSPLQQGKKNEINKVIISKGLPSSSSPLLRSKDPRIVRVSRASGGKDRHSKVFTVRGLRDRRVRLSVPTAIQLYDLQDRLGLNQPSKVVDWLLNEAKYEIEELPPLPNMPSLNHKMVPLNAPQEGLKHPTGGFWRDKSKEIAMESSNDDNKGSESHQGGQVTMPMPMPMPFGSYYHFEPSNFSLSHIGSHGYAALPHSTEELHSTANGVPLSSTLSLSSGSQILDPRQQVNHFQMLMASGSQNPFSNPPPYSMSQPLTPFHLSITPRLQRDKEHEFPPK